MSTPGPARTHEAGFCVPATHPALAGHFPGRPVVPGVVILDQVLECAEEWLGQPLAPRSVPQAKFVSPLLPGQRTRVGMTLLGTSLRFEVTVDGRPIAQGICTLREVP